jgi:hypothetical protein
LFQSKKKCEQSEVHLSAEFTTGVVVTRDEFTPSVIVTSDEFTGGRLIASINDTGGY